MLLTTFLLPACGGGGATSPTGPVLLSVGGSYTVAVSLVSNACGAVTVMTQPTTVTHTPGANRFSLTHGITYSGSVGNDGAFTSDPLTVRDDAGQNNALAIAGRFSTGGLDALVTVDVTRSADTCRYTVHWVGTKQGAANVLP